MLEAILLVKPLESWAVDVSEKLGVPIRIAECTTSREGLVSGLVKFNLEGTSKESILEALSRHPDVKNVHFSEESDGVIIGSLTMNRWLVCSSLQRADCYIEGALTRMDGAVEWCILVTDESVLRDLINDLEKAACEVKLLKKRQINESAALTKRQEWVIEKAKEMGYFDYPRKVTGRDLARRLGMAQSTMYEILQGAQKKLIEMYLLRKSLS